MFKAILASLVYWGHQSAIISSLYSLESIAEGNMKSPLVKATKRIIKAM